MDQQVTNHPVAHNATSVERKGDRELVVTRTFAVLTSRAFSRTLMCFFMPVSVIWNFSARLVIEASVRPSCSITPRRVASESAAKERSRSGVAY